MVAMIRRMMKSPDELADQEVEPYDVRRGTCPRCGSRAVVHHLYGLPDPRAVESWPRWISWEGCLRDVFDRSCRACGARWSEDGDE